MTRSLPLAAATAFGLGMVTMAQAQSSVSVYGLMDMSAGQFQAAGAEKVWKAESGNMTTSFLGFKGTEDLGGGLKARFQIEHFLRLDAGAAGRYNGDAFWARTAFVGLQGAFGASSLGRNTTPLFVSTLLFNPFGDSFGFSPSIRHWFLGAVAGDTGWSNSLAYNSPKYGGLSVNLLGNLGEGAAGAQGKNLGGNLLYFGGPFAATLAWQQVRNGGLPVGATKQDAFQLGGSYDIGAAKLFLQVGHIKTEAATDTKTRLYEFGATVPVGLGRLLASYGHAKASATAAGVTLKTLSLGYDHNLSKNTDVYAVYMNDRATALDTGNTFAAGIRLRF
jgi:predicted porin